MNTLRISSDRSSEPLPAAPPPREPSSDPLAAPARTAAPARPRVPAPQPAPPAPPAPPRPPAEPLSVSGPRKVIVTARHIAALLEREPSLWPGLTACVTDTDGRMIVHYAVLAPGGTEVPAPATDPEPAARSANSARSSAPSAPAGPADDTADREGDGGGDRPVRVPSPGPATGAVPARWRMLLAGVRESHRVQGREHVTVLRGIYAGLPVTVLFTVLACA